MTSPLPDGINIGGVIPPLHPRSWVETPVVIQATLAPNNLIQVGAFTGIYGGRLGHCNVGRYCSIAPGVDIASDQHPVNWLSTSMIQYVDNIHSWGRWLEKNGETYCPPKQPFNSNALVEIGHDVWIGQGVFVKSGVKIGHGAIVAAHTVVLEDLPAYAIAAGVPAKVKRYRFDEPTIARLLALQWWNYNITALADMDFSNVNTAMDRIIAAVENGELKELISPKYHFKAD